MNNSVRAQPLDGNVHFRTILVEKRIEKCSHIMYMLRFLNPFFHQPCLETERFSQS